MRYFLDAEFFEDGRTIDLISLALVADDGREFYAVNREAQLDRVNDWLRQNVLPSLPPPGDEAWMPHSEIGRRAAEFADVGSYGKPEFWAYYGAYDWVVFCQCFGTMMGLPKGWPKYFRELKQLSMDVGSPKHPPAPSGAHNALVDARWNRDLLSFLMAHKLAM
jgi:hypothetical protein